MKFVKIVSPKPVIEYVVSALSAHLRAGERVLWLISGGSAIELEVEIARRLEGTATLSVSLTDERPGPVGHPDSNWLLLAQAGFSLPGAALRPVLTGAQTLEDATAFAAFLDRELDAADYSFGLFGMGPDGHTAGIPAVGAYDQESSAAYYEAGDFRRISMTPASIARLSEAAACVRGQARRVQLERLATALPITEQSAQALKLAPKTTIFNELQGDPV